MEKLSFGLSLTALLAFVIPFLGLSSLTPSLLCFLVFLYCYGSGLILYLNKPRTDSWKEVLTTVLLILETLPILFMAGLWLLYILLDGSGISFG